MAAHATRRFNLILHFVGWMLVGAATPVNAGTVGGTVHGVAPNTVLPITQDAQPVGQIVVGQNGTYSIFLAPGEYVVQCPNHNNPTIRASSGPVVQDITC